MGPISYFLFLPSIHGRETLSENQEYVKTNAHRMAVFSAIATVKCKNHFQINHTVKMAQATLAFKTRPTVSYLSAKPCYPGTKQCLSLPVFRLGKPLPSQGRTTGAEPLHSKPSLSHFPFFVRKKLTTLQVTTSTLRASAPTKPAAGAPKTTRSGTGAPTSRAPTPTPTATPLSSWRGTRCIWSRRRPSVTTCRPGAWRSRARAAGATACRARSIRGRTA